MKLLIKKGVTSYLTAIFIQDSSSATGAGLTGLTSGSSGLVCYRARADDGNAAATQITLSAGTRGTWSSGGFVEKDATNMPGWYELGIPNAALATGSNYVALHLKGATNMAPLPIEIQLTDFDPQDGIHLGLTSLPNTAVTGNASLLTSGTGTDQISVTSGRIDVGKALGTAVTLDANNVLNVSTKYLGGTLQTARDIGASVLLSAGTGTGQLDFTSGVAKANLAQILGTALTETAGQIAAAFKQWFNVATPTGTVNSIPNATAGASGGLLIAGANAATTVNITGNITGNLSGSVGSVTARVTANTDTWAGGTIPAPNVTGVPLVDIKYSLGTLNPASPGYVAPDWGQVANKTTTNALTGTTISASQAVASVSGAVGSVTGNVGGNVTGSVGSVLAAVPVTSNIKKNSASRLTFTMTDSTTHNPKTGLTVTGQVSIDGGSFSNLTNTPASEISNGDYTIALAAGDTNGNTLMYRFTAASSDDLNIMVMTQP